MLSHKIIRNTAYNYIGRIWGVAVAIFLTPYIVKGIGVERFSIWAIAGVVTGYFSLLDFGVGSSFVKYIAEFHARDDTNKLNELVATGFIFYSALSAVLIAFTPFYIHPLLDILKIPAHLYSDAAFAFTVGVVIFCASNALSIFPAIQGGLQRMDITNKIGIAASIPNIAGVIFCIRGGYGLRGLIVNNLVIFLATAAANIVVAYRLLPRLRISRRYFSKEMFRTLFGFGVKLQVARISSMISVNIDKLLIAYFLSIGLVTYFQLGSSVVEQIKSVSLLLISALIPAFSEMAGVERRGELIDGYVRGTKYVALAVTPLIVFTVIYSRQIMFVWMGPGYEMSATVIRILAAGWAFAILSAMRSVMVQALTRPDIEMKAGLIAALVNIPVSIFLIIRMGFLGVAFGTAIAIAFSAAYGIIKLHAEMRLPVWPFVRHTLLASMAPSLCLGAAFAALTVLLPDACNYDRMRSLYILIARSLLFAAAYVAALAVVKPLDSSDLRTLSRGREGIVSRILTVFCRP